MHRGRPAVVVALLVAVLPGAAGCTAGERGAAEARPPTSATSGPAATAGTPAPGHGSGTPGPATGPAPPPSSAPVGGLPTAAELAAATADVSRLSTRALAGQLVVARYAGDSATAAAALVSRLGLGGVVVFADNVPDRPADVVPAMRSSAGRVAAAMARQGRDWPAFLAVDQEGGPVARIGSPATRFPGAMALGAAADPALARSVGAASGAELRAMGFTVVLAPVADVTMGRSDPTIGVRSPGSSPAGVAATVSGLVAGYLSAGIVPVAKHFPGHGSVTTDSHAGLPVQRARLSTLASRDLVPFRRLVADDAPAVMTAHIVLAGVDAERPASLSAAVTGGLLRRTLGFRGLVVTDALEMAAVSRRHGAGDAAVLAVRAGADVLLMPADPASAVDALVAAVAERRITRDRLVESAARMVAVLRHDLGPQPAVSVVGRHGDRARALADASVTVLSGPCSGRLVGSSVRVAGALSSDRARMATALGKVGVRVRSSGADPVVRLLGGGTYLAGGRASGSQSGEGAVVVALDVPYWLATSRATTARVAAYGRSQATLDAVARVLAGRQPARGTLPVAVGDRPVGSGCR